MQILIIIFLVFIWLQNLGMEWMKFYRLCVKMEKKILNVKIDYMFLKSLLKAHVRMPRTKYYKNKDDIYVYKQCGNAQSDALMHIRL